MNVEKLRLIVIGEKGEKRSINLWEAVLAGRVYVKTNPMTKWVAVDIGSEDPGVIEQYPAIDAPKVTSEKITVSRQAMERLMAEHGLTEEDFIVTTEDSHDQ